MIPNIDFAFPFPPILRFWFHSIDRWQFIWTDHLGPINYLSIGVDVGANWRGHWNQTKTKQIELNYTECHTSVAVDNSRKSKPVRLVCQTNKDIVQREKTHTHIHVTIWFIYDVFSSQKPFYRRLDNFHNLMVSAFTLCVCVCFILFLEIQQIKARRFLLKIQHINTHLCTSNSRRPV